MAEFSVHNVVKAKARIRECFNQWTYWEIGIELHWSCRITGESGYDKLALYANEEAVAVQIAESFGAEIEKEVIENG